MNQDCKFNNMYIYIYRIPYINTCASRHQLISEFLGIDAPFMAWSHSIRDSLLMEARAASMIEVVQLVDS